MEKENFEKIIAKYLEGSANPEEKEFIEKYLDDFQGDGGSWNLSEMGEEDLVKTNIYQRTLDEIKLKEQKGRIFRLRWLSAAAVLVVLFSGLYYVLKDEAGIVTATSGFKNDVLPGVAKATLTLADGRQISLDSQHSGTLTRQGSIVIRKTKAGQLIYDLSETGKPEKNESATAYNTISTPNGGKYMIILGDGTRVWINSASSLRFPVAFKASTRNVELKGEAYFEVAGDKNRPFYVSSRGLEVKVLGTHFNINAYENEPSARTTLLDGAVEVSHGQQRVVLKPGNQAEISQRGIRFLKNADTEEVIAWKNGFFQFRDARLSDIMRQLSRWYDVEVEYSAGLPDEEYTGIIAKSVKISKVLEMLEQGGGVEFRIEGKKITVLPTDK